MMTQAVRSKDPGARLDSRIAAVGLLGRDEKARAKDVLFFQELLTPQTPGELQRAAVAGFTRLPATNSRGLLSRWRALSPSLRAAVLDVLLSREASIKTLLEHVQNESVSAAELGATRRRSLREHTSPAIRRLAARVLEKTANPRRAEVLKKYGDVLSASSRSRSGR